MLLIIILQLIMKKSILHHQNQIYSFMIPHRYNVKL